MCLSPAADGGRARRGGTQGPSDLRGARGPRVLDWVPHGTDEGGGFCLQERDEATWGPACEGRGGWQSLQPNPCHFAKGQHVLRRSPRSGGPQNLCLWRGGQALSGCQAVSLRPLPVPRRDPPTVPAARRERLVPEGPQHPPHRGGLGLAARLALQDPVHCDTCTRSLRS